MDGEELKNHDDIDEEEVDPAENEAKEFKNLDAEIMKKIEDNFAIFDKEQSQTIDIAALGTLLRWLKFNPTETEMEGYVTTYDSSRRNQITLENCKTIVNQRILEPDTIDEFVEAAKEFDHDNDGKIEVAELRYAMTMLGDKLDETLVDDLIGELDKEKTGFVEIVEWARITFK